MTNHPNRSKVKDWPEYLRKFRERHNLSQAELADNLEISKRLVENWEGKINTPPSYLKGALLNLARKLSKTIPSP